MKKFVETFALLLCSFVSWGQAATLVPNQSIPKDTTVSNFMYIGASNRMYVANQSFMRMKWINVPFMGDTLVSRMAPYMKTQTAADSIGAMNARISQRLMKTDTTGKWKPIGYVPSWSSITNKPSFAAVSVSGSYNDLANKPTITAPVNADWNSNSGLSQIQNKPTLSSVAISGSYNDLTSKPSIPTVPSNVSAFVNDANYLTTVPAQSYASLTGKPDLSIYYPKSNPDGFISSVPPQSWASITSKPTFFSGNYSDLVGAPTIPAAQVNADWNSVSGVSVILNKPTIPTNTNQLTNGAGFLTSVPAQSYVSLTGKPTTLSGYGITDAYPLTANPSNFLTSITGAQVTTALGFVPYPSVGNPAGYLTGESDPLFDSKFAAKNTGGLSEGANLYWTSARFNTAFSGKSSTDLPEGTNLYYTAARFNTAFAGKNTDGLAEGATNLYFNNTRSRASISLTTTGSGASTYNSSTGALNVPTPVNYSAGTGIDITSGVISASANAVTFNNAPGRTIGTSFQVSTTRPARVSYTVSCVTGLSLLNLNSNAQVFLEISANNSTWITVNGAGSTKTLAVSISVGLNETSLFNVQCEVPAGYYVRLRSVTSGGGSTAFSSGQEIIY